MTAVTHQNRYSHTEIVWLEGIRDALDSELLSFLQDTKVNEIIINESGAIVLDTTEGKQHKGYFDPNKRNAFCSLIASYNRTELTYKNPIISAELPVYKELRGERVQINSLPVTTAPTINIRKRAELIYTLSDYGASGRLSQQGQVFLLAAIETGKNIIISGAPGSGKTTFTNALINASVTFNPGKRFLILEDIPELQCRAEDHVNMLSSEHADMTALLRSAVRMRPDAILVGEVRGKEALDLLKAWNLGCSGGISTLHANGCIEAIQRLADLAMESGLIHPPKSLIAHTVNVLVHVERKGDQKGFITEITELEGLSSSGEFIFNHIIGVNNE